MLFHKINGCFNQINAASNYITMRCAQPLNSRRSPLSRSLVDAIRYGRQIADLCARFRKKSAASAIKLIEDTSPAEKLQSG